MSDFFQEPLAGLSTETLSLIEQGQCRRAMIKWMDGICKGDQSLWLGALLVIKSQVESPSFGHLWVPNGGSADA